MVDTRDPDLIRILAWNIRHGGGRRIGGILDCIAAHAPDVAVLGEYRCDRSGAALCEGLGRIGLEFCAFLPSPERANSVLIASRLPIETPRPLGTGLERPHMLLDANVAGLALTAVYMPLGDDKTPYWEAVVDAAEARASMPALFIGDFNTGKHRIDEAKATFTSAAFMDRMEDAGFIDAWRWRHPEVREFTWTSPRGNGFRLDHAFVSPSLAARIAEIRYSHAERLDGVSDHSALVVDIRKP